MAPPSDRGMESRVHGRGLAAKAKAATFHSRREVLQRELQAERRRLGHLIVEHGLPVEKVKEGPLPHNTPTLMMLLLSYKIRDLAAELAALDSKARHAHR